MFSQLSVVHSALSLGREKRKLYQLASLMPIALIIRNRAFLSDLDCNKLFEEKRVEITSNVNEKIEKLKSQGFESFELEELEKTLRKTETKKASDIIDQNLLEKRPDQAKRQLRQILTKKTQDEATNLLSDLSLDEKGTEIARQLIQRVPRVKLDTPNDAALVLYINYKLCNKFGPVKNRENKILLSSVEAITTIIEELRKMISCM